MKTLKTSILGLIIALSFGAVQAKTIKAENEKLTVSFALNVYVNAVTHGQINGLNDVLDKNAKFSMMRGTELLNFNKTEELAFIKSTENTEQNCKTSTYITETNPDFTVVKVDMKYSGFVRTNYVTLANTNDGWKITSIYSVFKNN